MKALCQSGCKALSLLEKFGEPLVLLLVRLQVADFFWRSGKLKLDTYLEGHWEDTLSLFRDFHPVPYLPADIAAPLSMVSEAGFSVLLAIGFLSRGVAIGLLGVCGVIYITHMANYDNLGDFIEAPWLVPLLLVIVVRGGGCISADKILMSLFCKKGKCGMSEDA